MILFKMRDPVTLLKIRSLECRGVTGNAWCGAIAETRTATMAECSPGFEPLECELRCGWVGSAPSAPFPFFQGICLNFQVNLEMPVMNDFFFKTNDF